MKEIKKQEKYSDILAKLFLFEDVGSKALREAFESPQCICVQYEPGEIVYSRHCFQKNLGIVLNGELKAVKRAVDGGTLLLNTFFSGGVFGVAGLFHTSREYVSEVVAVKRSRVLFLPQRLLQALFRLEPKIAENYIGYLSDRICFLNSRIDNFTGGRAENRLAGFLISLSGEKETIVHLPFSMTEMADSLNIGRASLYRAFDTLTESGIIQRNSRQITIVDFERLKAGKF